MRKPGTQRSSVSCLTSHIEYGQDIDANLLSLSIRMREAFLVKVGFSTQHAISTSETHVTFSAVCACDSESQCEAMAQE